MSFEIIQDQLARLCRNEQSSEDAEQKLAEVPSKALASFVVDAFNRGWISRFNLGLDQDGNVI